MSWISLEDFERYSSRKTVQAVLRRIKISEEGTYEEFVDQLYDDIDETIYDMQAGRELRQNDGEDRLSSEIIGGLKRYGYMAFADGKTGGHVDISVRLGDHSWIGEAKKDGNFHEGFLQLSTRYVQASGNFKHNQGGLVFYLIKTPDALKKLRTWRDEITDAGYNCSECNRNELAFYFTHKLEGSGTDFKIRTMGVSLYHQPKDKSARNSAKKKTLTKK